MGRKNEPSESPNPPRMGSRDPGNDVPGEAQGYHCQVRGRGRSDNRSRAPGVAALEVQCCCIQQTSSASRRICLVQKEYARDAPARSDLLLRRAMQLSVPVCESWIELGDSCTSMMPLLFPPCAPPSQVVQRQLRHKVEPNQSWQQFPRRSSTASPPRARLRQHRRRCRRRCAARRACSRDGSR